MHQYGTVAWRPLNATASKSLKWKIPQYQDIANFFHRVNSLEHQKEHTRIYLNVVKWLRAFCP